LPESLLADSSGNKGGWNVENVDGVLTRRTCRNGGITGNKSRFEARVLTQGNANATAIKRHRGMYLSYLAPTRITTPLLPASLRVSPSHAIESRVPFRPFPSPAPPSRSSRALPRLVLLQSRPSSHPRRQSENARKGPRGERGLLESDPFIVDPVIREGSK